MNLARRFTGVALCSILTLSLWVPASLAEKPKIDTMAAWQMLKDGNARFVAGKPAVKDLSGKRRAELAKGQHPFAVVLTCADSRVAPEFIFDQGLGDLFVLRVAGNITDPEVLGSIEYAVEHLGSPLILVMGHESCGAVQAALAGGHLEGNLGKLIEHVNVGKDLPTDKQQAMAAGVRANVLYQAGELTKSSTVLKDFVATGRVKVVAGVYSLSSGEVTWVGLPSANGKKPK